MSRVANTILELLKRCGCLSRDSIYLSLQHRLGRDEITNALCELEAHNIIVNVLAVNNDVVVYSNEGKS